MSNFFLLFADIYLLFDLRKNIIWILAIFFLIACWRKQSFFAKKYYFSYIEFIIVCYHEELNKYTDFIIYFSPHLKLKTKY